MRRKNRLSIHFPFKTKSFDGSNAGDFSPLETDHFFSTHTISPASAIIEIDDG